MAKTQGQHGKDWIMTESLRVLETYGSDSVTLRQLYYRLVSAGMPNCIQSYKRVVAVMTEARKTGQVPYDAFEDRDRAIIGRTQSQTKMLDNEIESAKQMIKIWMRSHHLERWSNQETYLEVWIEKKALQGVLTDIASMEGVGLFACKGYPSLSSLYEASQRFGEARDNGKSLVIIYLGDYDPTGEDIPRSIQDSMASQFGLDIDVQRIALMESQVKEYNLPPAPVKDTDSRSKGWDGLGQVELDALEPTVLKDMTRKAIRSHFDQEAYKRLKLQESEERMTYQQALRDYVASGEVLED